LIMLDTVQELPTQIERDVWSAVRDLGDGGAMFSIESIRARVPKRVQASVEGCLRLLESAGFIETATAPRGANPCKAIKRFNVYRTRGTLDAQPVSIPPVAVSFDVAAHVTLQIPRNHDGIWSLMRWFAQHRGGFTLSDLREQIGGNIADDEVMTYVRALDRGGFIVPELTIGFDPRYRVNLRFIETPRLRVDGSLMAGPQRFGNMWRSMKMSGYFTALDLAIGASLPELPVSREQAARYADDLVAAGYLVARDRADEPRLYRLYPKMNTGPAAPIVLRARFVWDANLCRIMGQASAIDEVRP
jgi:hypothetical protein